MSIRIPLKSELLILFGALVCAAGTVLLINFLLSGPKLGRHYDFLLSRRKPPAVSREILIINTDDIIESGDVYRVLMTLTEMEAAALVLTARVSSSSPVSITESEIRRRFADEYALTGSNIRNLFEAIRMGSVTAAQAPGYVERLVELTEQGRDRLLAALIDRDEDLLRSIAVFGNFLETERAAFDRDGRLRRVKPFDVQTSQEHPVYLAIKERYAVSRIEYSDTGQILYLRKFGGEELDIPLDKDGNIISAVGAFRRIDAALFREYEEAGRALRSALVRADELGALSLTLPERSPLFLGDYALTLAEELLAFPDNEKRSEWIRARADYFKSLDDFLNGTAQARLVNGYEEVIADETSLESSSVLKLTGMRDELIQSFTTVREKYGGLLSLHSMLEEELYSSICIMGPESSTDYSALLANALITGSHIIPVHDRFVLFWSITVSVIVLLAVFMLRPSILLICGTGLSVLSSVVFGLVFIFSSLWIDPLIVLGSCFTGTLVVFYCKCAYLSRRARFFSAVYGTSVSQNVLKELIRSGKPHPSDIASATAAVVAVKDVNLLDREGKEKPQDAARNRKTFFSSVKRFAFNAGAVAAGFEGDTVLVCFGSPIDKSYNSVSKACSLVRELLKNGKTAWSFGIDSGECTFSWLPETGYSVYGRPAVRARLLASKTARFNVRALVTDSILEKITSGGKKTRALRDEDGDFYELPA
ncbi:MAG: hypothetical protein LBQ89_02895 [Treponema sp.]|jgi:hypothetical protein|nr:hypothetical protein [Treponema sp.]